MLIQNSAFNKHVERKVSNPQAPGKKIDRQPRCLEMKAAPGRKTVDIERNWDQSFDIWQGIPQIQSDRGSHCKRKNVNLCAEITATIISRFTRVTEFPGMPVATGGVAQMMIDARSSFSLGMADGHKSTDQ